jgi:hypothetical protein
MVELQNKIIGVAGRKGSGKSTLAHKMLARGSRFFIFDTMGEHGFPAGNGFHTFRDIGSAEEFLLWAQEQSRFAGRLIPQSNDLEAEFSELAEIVYEQGNMLLAIEEVPMLTRSPSYLPPQFDRLVRLGRHRQVSILWTCQRMAEVARRLTAATDVFVLFGHREPRDLEAISDRLGSDIAERVSRLDLHDCLAFDVVSRKELGRDAVLKLVRTATPARGLL